MAFFDFLTASNFKSTQEGHKLFFPWGPLGRGYVVAAQQDCERLERQLNNFFFISTLTSVAAAMVFGIWGLVVAALFPAYYAAVLKPRLLRGLQPSDERLSLRESAAAQGRAHSAIVLWLAEIFVLAWLGISIFLFIIAPQSRVIAVASILFCGLCAVSLAWMLVLRRAGTTG
jgi:hypothetical protein